MRSGIPFLCTAACLVLALAVPAAQAPAPSSSPHLERRGAATQLVVDGQPFLALAGELANNAATTLDAARALWPNLAAMRLNTVLIPISWDQIEPQEGRYDWTLVDGLVQGARQNHMKLVFLWFGSWKNTWSSYAPDWVKADFKRFPRIARHDGSADERLTPFSDANRDADARAFAALMRHVRDLDAAEHTVIMMQVENEVGSIPDARDYSPAASAAYAGPVPKALMDYLVAHKDALAPELAERWRAAGSKTAGTWTDVFGAGLETDDFFMAWAFARYINAVAEAGKREYDIPMYVNAALIRPSYVPGQYNSGGPLAHSLDIWRAGAPAIDFLAPDIYFNFKDWTAAFSRADNPLFIPETRGGAEGAADVFYAVGHHHAMGFSPFGVGSIPDGPLAASYDTVAQLAPLILAHQVSGAGMDAVVMDDLTLAQKIRVGDYTLQLTGTASPGRAAAAGRGAGAGPAASPPARYGIFIATGPNEFVMAGSNLGVTFVPETPGPSRVGLGTVQEGHFVDGRWVVTRQLGGDDTSQGQALTLRGTERGPEILRVTVYRYQ